MKKIAFITTILLIFLSFTTGVSADSDVKDIQVILSETAAVVNMGDIIPLTATTLKHGSTYSDNWGNAVKSVTEYDPITASYISKGIFTAEKPGIHTISYTIKMVAGDSGTVFSKTVVRTIEVIDPRTVIGADIRDLQITPIYAADGSISVYKAYGTIYALWSDDTVTQKGSIYFFFNPSETTKNIDVTFTMDGKLYAYTVTVNR
ncbi:MAG: hypothetical protein K0R31_40 [Clostridiales bacterium]|jgi:hypothetical protein|nr:hypothetical protein [Clostridiales bacterium]MDF2890875.1 hypothetical protein [Clostridia bacterium]